MSKPTAHAQHVRSAYDKRQRSAGIGGELRSTASSSRSGCKNYMAWSKRQQADAKRVVRGRVELPTFRFSGQSVETLYWPGLMHLSSERDTNKRIAFDEQHRNESDGSQQPWNADNNEALTQRAQTARSLWASWMSALWC